MNEKLHIYEFRVRRVRRSVACESPPDTLRRIIADPNGASQVFRAFASGEARELFMVMSLSHANEVIGVEVTGVGSIANVDACPREVFRAAILTSASGIIVAHNHPSNTVRPSIDDWRIYQQLKEAGEIIGIPVLDSLVVSSDPEIPHYYSMRDNKENAPCLPTS